MLFDTLCREKKREKNRIEIENEMCFFFSDREKKSKHRIMKEKKNLNLYEHQNLNEIDEYRMNIVNEGFFSMIKRLYTRPSEHKSVL